MNSEQLVNNVDVKSKLMSQYASWKGVAYRLGGTTRLLIAPHLSVRLSFDQFGMELPRSTAEQQSVGTSVKRAKLQAGDRCYLKPENVSAMSVFMSAMTNLSMHPLRTVISSQT